MFGLILSISFKKNSGESDPHFTWFLEITDSNSPKVGKIAMVQEDVSDVTFSSLDSSVSERIITIHKGSSIKILGFGIMFRSSQTNEHKKIRRMLNRRYFT